MSPIQKLQYRIWRIENAFGRRAATVATALFVQLPLHLLYWLCLPLLIVFCVVFPAIIELIEQLRDVPRMTLREFTDWPDKMREKRRVFGVMWRSSKSEWIAEREAAAKVPLKGRLPG